MNQTQHKNKKDTHTHSENRRQESLRSGDGAEVRETQPKKCLLWLWLGVALRQGRTATNQRME
jgi:hypothetical protein